MLPEGTAGRRGCGVGGGRRGRARRRAGRGGRRGGVGVAVGDGPVARRSPTVPTPGRVPQAASRRAATLAAASVAAVDDDAGAHRVLVGRRKVATSDAGGVVERWRGRAGRGSAAARGTPRPGRRDADVVLLPDPVPGGERARRRARAATTRDAGEPDDGVRDRGGVGPCSSSASSSSGAAVSAAARSAARAAVLGASAAAAHGPRPRRPTDGRGVGGRPARRRRPRRCTVMLSGAPARAGQRDEPLARSRRAGRAAAQGLLRGSPR